MAAPPATCSISKDAVQYCAAYTTNRYSWTMGARSLADDSYIRESILDPNAKVVSGFQPNIMPNFKGQLSEEQVIQLIAFVKSLSPPAPASQQGGQQRPVVIAPRAKTPAAALPAGSAANPAPQAVRGHRRIKESTRMATIAQGTPEIAAEEVNYLNVEHGWKSWLFTTDHKRIAFLYLISITLMFFVGGTMAVLFRINLLEPEGIFSAETYNRLFLDARHRDGVLLPGAFDSGNTRQLPDSHHDRGQRSGLPAH